MIFMLAFYADEQALARLSIEEYNALVDRHVAFREEAIARADVLESRAMQPSGAAVTVRPTGDGWSTRPGPAVDLAEGFTGYYLIDCASQEAAVALAQHYPMPEGLGCIEVRPVLADWDYAPSQETTAAPTVVWSRYVDVKGWPRWRHGVRAVDVDGSFRAGASGTFTRDDGRRIPWRIVAVQEGVSFVTETELAPSATLREEHVVQALPGGGTRIVQRANVSRSLVDALGTEFGPWLYEGLQKSVAALAADVEAESAGREVANQA